MATWWRQENFQHKRRWLFLAEFLLVLLRAAAVPAVAQTSLPPFLAVTPSSQTITLAHSVSFSVVDQKGLPLKDAQWSISPGIAELLFEDGRLEILPKGSGRATLTATVGGRSATATLTVLSASESTVATVDWSVLPIFGFETLLSLPAMPSPDSDVAYYSIEWNKTENALLRAFDESGQQLWMRILSSNASPSALLHVLPPSGEVTLNDQIMSDHSVFIIGEKSGFAANNSTDPTTQGLPPDGKSLLLQITGDAVGGILLLERGRFRDSLIDIAADGHEAWRYRSKGRLSKNWTANFDSNVAIVETLSKPVSSALLVLNGATGQPRFQIPFPISSSTINGFRCQDARRNVLKSYRPSVAGTVFTNSDSNIYVQVETHVESLDIEKCENKQYAFDDTIALLRVTPDGLTEWTTFEHIHADDNGSLHAQPRVFAGESIPDGLGGVLAAWTILYPDSKSGQPLHSEARLTRIGPSGQRDFTLPLIFWTPGISSPFDENMVLGSDNILYATNGPLLVCFDILAGQVSWQRHPPTGKAKLQYATAGGGVLVSNAGQLVHFDNSGNGVALPWTSALPNVEDIGLVQVNSFDHTLLPPLVLRNARPTWTGGFIGVEEGAPLGRGALLRIVVGDHGTRKAPQSQPDSNPT
jgi:hypothetical protein